MDAGFNVRITADVSNAVQNVGSLTGSLAQSESEMRALGLAIDHAIDKGEDITKLEDAFQQVSNRVKALKAEIGQGLPPVVVPPIHVPDDGPLLGSLAKQRVAFVDLGRIITGQGFSLRSLAANFTLLGPGVTIAVAALYGLYEILSKQTDEEKRAEKAANDLKETLLNLKKAVDITSEATGSEQGNIARVQALSAAVKDSNLTYKERQNALNELRETNKAYFGDLTLEANSLATLNQRVKDYSNALITEAVVKGQVAAIAELSLKLSDQVKVLDNLKAARDRAANDQATAKITDTGAGMGFGVGSSMAEEIQLAFAVDRTEGAFKKQQEAVDTLRTAIAAYRGELDKAIGEQIQQKPLTDAPKAKDDLKSIIPILQEIKRIQDELAKPDKRIIHDRLSDSTDVIDAKVIETQIREAIKNAATKGANDPEIASAYSKLAEVLGEKLSALRNPDLHTHIQPIADIDDKEIVEFQKNSGKLLTDYMKRLPPIKSDTKVQFTFTDFQQYLVDYKKKLDTLQKQAINGLRDFTRNVQEQAAISLGKGLGEGNLKNAFDGFVSYLGGAIEKLGEQLLIASGLFQAVDASLSALFDNPLLAAAVGVAAIAAGAAIKKSFKATPFAEGGIVTGPTYALIGEAGPEAVLPFNKIGQLFNSFQPKSQNVNVSGNFRINGTDLVLTMARANKNRNLVQ